MLREQHRFFRSVLIALDTTVVAGAVVAAWRIRFDVLPRFLPAARVDEPAPYATHALPLLVLVPFVLFTLHWLGLYRVRRDRPFIGEAFLLARGVVIATFLSFAFIQFFSKPLFDGRDFSRLQYMVFAGTAATMLTVWRAGFRLSLGGLRRRGWNLRHVAIVGTGRMGQRAFDAFTRHGWTGIRPAYFISHHATTTREQCRGLPVHGGLDDLERILDAHEVSGVILALQGRSAHELPVIVRRLERYPVDVRIIPDMDPRLLLINMAVNELDGLAILSMRESPLSGWGAVAKRAIDLAGSIVGLLVFALPMLLIALLTRLSGPGPVLFRQKRVSMGGQPFTLYKFRTMVPRPASPPDADAGRGTDAWTRRDDPRITPLGRLLRSSSLDELPQLFNVLRGDMSLVGPRPERPELIETFREDRRGYMPRHIVKAGITGWAQVNGLRGDTSLDKRLQYDLFYIRNWSLGFDLRILWMTLFRGFVHPNAG